MKFILQGGGKREASRIFNIGEDTIYKWIRRYNEGNLEAKKRTHFRTKIPIERLLKYVKENPDHTLKDIGQRVNLSITRVWEHLKRLGWTRKKDHALCRVLRRKAGPI